MVVEVDLHLHTTFSDGNLTPTELIDLCAEKGLNTVTVCSIVPSRVHGTVNV